MQEDVKNSSSVRNGLKVMLQWIARRTFVLNVLGIKTGVLEEKEGKFWRFDGWDQLEGDAVQVLMPPLANEKHEGR